MLVKHAVMLADFSPDYTPSQFREKVLGTNATDVYIGFTTMDELMHNKRPKATLKSIEEIDKFYIATIDIPEQYIKLYNKFKEDKTVLYLHPVYRASDGVLYRPPDQYWIDMWLMNGFFVDEPFKGGDSNEI